MQKQSHLIAMPAPPEKEMEVGQWYVGFAQATDEEVHQLVGE